MLTTSAPRKIDGVLVLGTVAHGLAAWLCIGPHQADEHFQILELLCHKLDHTPAADLPWEHAAKIRPFVEIVPLYVVARLERALGVSDPFLVERSFRLLFAAFGLASGLALARMARPLLRTERAFRALIAAECLYFPVVYVHARLSAEACGTTLFLFGLSRLGPGTIRNAALSGALMGLAFMTRFQLAFAIAGGALHLCLVSRAPLRVLATWTSGFAIAVLAGVLADYWGYGALVFTPARYFTANLLEGKAALFGVSPWWGYFPPIVKWLVPPFSLVVLAGFAWFVAAHRRSVVTWVTVPFFFGHVLVAHKELRFLFPLVPFAPLFFLAFVEQAWIGARPWLRRGGSAATALYMAVSVAALPLFTWYPPLPDTRYFEYVLRHYGDAYRPFYMNDPPMQDADLPVHFYRPHHYEPQHVGSYAELDLATRRAGGLYFEITSALPPAAGPLVARCPPRFRTVPEWMRRTGLARALDYEEWTLFECRPALSGSSGL